MNALEQIFYSQQHEVCHKWNHYFEIYELYFRKFRDRPIRFVEIGVAQGGSLTLWSRYFLHSSDIVGIDIDPACKQHERDGIRVFIGDQADKRFLADVVDKTGLIDIVLDDGGHTMEQQISTFDVLFPAIRPGGLYMCENVHTSYQSSFGGGLRTPGSFIEYMKSKIDEMYYSELAEENTEVTNSAHSISFYRSMVVVEKGTILPANIVEVGV